MPQSSLRWLVLLLLVPLSSTTTQLAPHCKDKEMSCFVNNKCTNTDPEADNTLATISYDKICEVHLEIRPYSDKKALIRIKAKQAPVKIVYEDSPTTPIIQCEIDKDGVVQSTGDGQTLFHGEKWQSGIACDVLYERSPTLFEPLKIVHLMYGPQPTEIKGGFKNQIWTKAESSIKCDMDWLQKKDLVDDKDWIYVEADRRFNDVVCPADTELVYREGDEAVQVAAGGIKCEEEAPEAKDWRYRIYKDAPKKSSKASATTPAAPPEVTGPDSTTFVACRTRVCAQCKAVEIPCTAPAKCPKPAAADGCNILKCDTNITKVNDGLANFGHASCTQKEGEEGEKIFGWTYNGNEVKKIECADSVSCYQLNPIKLDGNDVASDNDVKCEGQKKISVDGNPVKSITCDDKTGNWRVNKTSDLPSSAVLACTEFETSTPVATGAMMSDLALQCTLGVVAGLIILAVSGIVIFILVCKPKMKKRKDAKKIKTIVSSRTDDNVKTALPYNIAPLPTATMSDPLKPPKPEPELIEKTMIAHTPEPKSVMMKTAILPAMTEAEEEEQILKDMKFADTVEWGPDQRVTDLKKLQQEQQLQQQRQQQKSQSEGSDPRPVRIGKNGEVIGSRRKGERSGEKSEDKSKQSETKKEEKPAKPVDTGPKPRVFPLDPKEEKIRKGATVKASDYPTLAEIDSDWEDYDEAKAKAAGNIEAGKKKKGGRGKTQDRTKTVPTAVTPDVNPDKQASIERTQATNTRNTVDKGEADLDHLVTQLDTTAEQKKADGKKK